MSKSGAVIDLTEEDSSPRPTPTARPRAKRQREREEGEVWVVIHQLERGGYGCIGDWSDTRGALSHEPETFDAKIVGVFRSRDDANRRAREYSIAHDIGDDDDEDEDFVGEGRFKDGAETSGDVNTFSERVFVERHVVE